MNLAKSACTLLLVYLLAGCSKNSDPVPVNLPVPQIISISAGNLTTGMEVVIEGKNFGSNINSLALHFDSTVITLTRVTDTRITFTIPANLITEGFHDFTVQVSVNGVSSNKITVRITYVQHGWRYINKDFDPLPETPNKLYFFDNPCNVGMLSMQYSIYLTSSDGAGWGGMWPYGQVGAMDVFDDHIIWNTMGKKDIFITDYHGCGDNFYSKMARLDTIASIPHLQDKTISGLFLTGVNSGYFLTNDGSLFKSNGSFKPEDINLDYRSSYFYDLKDTASVEGYWGLSGIDSNNLMFIGYPKVINQSQPLIIVKRNGIYKEYNVSSLLPVGWPSKTYFVDKDNLYCTTINYDLFKLDLSTDTWKRMDIPDLTRFCFLNKDTIYASDVAKLGVDYRYIYKSTDGGKKWNVDFGLDRFQYVDAMCTKNRKVWVVGHESNQHKTFTLKYVP